MGKLSLYEFQSACKQLVRAALDTGARTMFQLPTGGGKCLAPGTGVLRFDGSVARVEDVRSGDLLLGPDGKGRRVLSITAGRGQMVEVRPTKGSAWQCNDDHILTLAKTPERAGEREAELVDVSVKEWLEWPKSRKHLYKLVRAAGVPFTEQKLPIHPYLLGLLLGDGRFMKQGRGIQLTTGDAEIAERAKWLAMGEGVNLVPYAGRNYGFTTLAGQPNRLLDVLKVLGLEAKSSTDKFIPPLYRVGSMEQRRELLAGLIDSDGSLGHNAYDYLSKSEQLAEGVAFIARSLGLAAYQSTRVISSGPYRGNVYHRVSISGEISQVPCVLPRKRGAKRQQKKSVRRTGFAIKSVGAGDYYGFKLSGDGRFLLADFTVTHNSETGLSLIEDVVLEGGKVLWITHRAELVDQVIRRAQQYGIPAVDVYSGKQPYQDYGLHVQSVGKVHNVPDHWRPRLVVIDEAHHATAPTWARVIEKFHAQGAHILGMTATPWRLSNTEGYDHLFDELVCGPQTLKLVQDGYLTMPLVVRSSSQELRGTRADLLGTTGDYSAGRMEKRIGPSLVSIPVAEWEEWCQERRTIIYVVSRRIALDVAARIQQAGGRVGLLYSESKTDREDENWNALVEQAVAAGVHIGTMHERKPVVDAFGDGSLNVMVNVEIFTEGVDCPGANAVILARPTKSLALQRQMVGRALRIAVGKDDALIVDCAGTIDEYQVGHPLTDYDWQLAARKTKGSGEAPVVTCQCGNANPPAVRYCLTCDNPMGTWCLRCREWRARWGEGVDEEAFSTDTRSGPDLARAYHIEKTIAICDRCTLDLAHIVQNRESERKVEHPLKCSQCGGAKRPEYDLCRQCGSNQCPRCGRIKQSKYPLCYPCAQVEPEA